MSSPEDCRFSEMSLPSEMMTLGRPNLSYLIWEEEKDSICPSVSG